MSSYSDDKSLAEYVVIQGVCMASSTLLTLYVELYLRKRKYHSMDPMFLTLQNAINITHKRIVEQMERGKK